MYFVARFFKIFDYVLQESQGRAPLKDWGLVSEELGGLFDAEKASPIPPGLGPADREESLCPVLLWTDERFLTSKRPDAFLWYSHSLQRKILSTNRGGELFFKRLKSLLAFREAHLGKSGASESFKAKALSGQAREIRDARNSFDGKEEGEPWGGEMRFLGYDLRTNSLSQISPGALPKESGLFREGIADGASPLFPLGEYPSKAEELSPLDEAFLPVKEEDPLEEIVRLWVRPGEGFEPLESIIDAYAMCLVLGFKGRIIGKGELVIPAEDFPFGLEGAGLDGLGEGLDGVGGVGMDGSGGAGFGSGGVGIGREIMDGSHSGGRFTSSLFPSEEDPLEKLLFLSRKQMSRWAIKGRDPLSGKRGLGFFQKLSDFWQEHGWIFYFILVPVAVLAILYWYAGEIVENLPF
jgi:hypothetical protein